MGLVAGGLGTEVSVPMQAADFAVFVDTRRDQAVRMAFRLLGGDQAAAEDVAQNAFFRAHRSLAGFRGESSVATWFYRILVREAQRYRRWQAVRRLWSGDSEAAPEPADDRPQADPLLRRRIVAALDRVTTAQREAFVLVHLEGISVTEAAAILSKAPGTVKSHLHRALESLRGDLADLRTTAAPNRVPRGNES